MEIDVNADTIKQLKADNRGRVNLGMEYRNQTVELAIIDTHNGEETPTATCPDCGSLSIETVDWGDQGTLFNCTECEWELVP